MNRNINEEKKIFVISQLSGNTPEEVDKNKRLAIKVAKILHDNGFLPIVPHIYFPQFMDDKDKDSREYGIKAGHWLMRFCDSALLVTIDNIVSRGMEEDLKFAKTLGMKISSINLTVQNKEQLIKNK